MEQPLVLGGTSVEVAATIVLLLSLGITAAWVWKLYR